jgi:tripartite ATP-independent transporter DctM subunit
MGGSLFVMVYLCAKKRNYPIYKKTTLRERIHATRYAFWSLLTPGLVLFGITAGMVTPTEAAVLTIVYALVITIFVYKEFKLKNFMKLALDTVETTGTVVMLMAAAGLFGWTLSRAQVPQQLTAAMVSFTSSPIVILLMLNVLLLILGCFIEGLAIIVILVPIVMPILQATGISPVHFGVMMVINVTIGAITPPVGTYLYIMAKVTNMPLEKVIKGVGPWIIPLVIALLIVVFVPDTVLFLPRLFGFV